MPNGLATSLRGMGPPVVMTAAGRVRHGAHVVTPARPADTNPPDPRTVAREAGLRYTTDTRPGITRRRSGKGFSYREADGTTIRDPEILGRIRSLAIPPAWTDVWICPWPTGHLQASGRDARGRKQYRYHAAWQQRRGIDKFDRMLAFADALPRIRRRCDADLATRGLSRDKVLAAVVRLLELTLIRVGNDEYARLNRSFGLTTLRDRHARIEGSAVRFRFRGKSGRQHEVGLRDRRLAGVVRRCQELPGQELFQFVDEAGEVRDVASDDVNDYIREASGGDFTAKDFRTWAGTVLAYRALRALQPGSGERAAKQNVVEAIRQTADRLGNTPAVARGSYVHPAVLEAYLEGSIRGALVEAAEEQETPPIGATPAEERQVRALLRQRLADDAARSSGRRTGAKGARGQAADS
jgi:DNA topoisomerase-1